MYALYLSPIAPAAFLWIYTLGKLDGYAKHVPLAAAFLLSLVGDSASHHFAGAWWPSFVWLPAQMTLALWAYVTDHWHRIFAGGMLVILSAASWTASYGKPDLIVTMVGSLAIVLVARGPTRAAAWAYFGFGSLFYVLMVAKIGHELPDYMRPWKLYQTCRIVAYAAFIIGIAMERRRLAWSS